MAEIILDIGSGRSLHNVERAKKMILGVAMGDMHKHRIVFKTQLFQNAPPNIPLEHEAFDTLYHYADTLGYPMTSSVFDKDSLSFLLRYRIPFVKIACRADLYWLIGEIPRKVPVYLSWTGSSYPQRSMGFSDTWMYCSPNYPAEVKDYKNAINRISDHTVGLELFRKMDLDTWEKHLCPEREDSNPDSGPFALTVEELYEVIA